MSMRIRFARAAVAAGLLGCATGITLGVAFVEVDDAAVKIARHRGDGGWRHPMIAGPWAPIRMI